jgi:hypothetical protein
MGISWKRPREESKQERKRKFRISEDANKLQEKAAFGTSRQHILYYDAQSPPRERADAPDYGSPVVTLAPG